MKKRFFAWMLCILMLAGLLPAQVAYAETKAGQTCPYCHQGRWDLAYSYATEHAMGCSNAACEHYYVSGTWEWGYHTVGGSRCTPGNCDICGLYYDLSHSGGTATCTSGPICEKCGQEYGSALGHDWQTEWTIDGDVHYHACSQCTERKDEAAHNYVWTYVDDDTHKGVCECGAEITETHDWGAWKRDDNGSAHYRVCQRAGCTAKETEEHHEDRFTSASDTEHYVICSVCSTGGTVFKREPHSGGTATCTEKAVCEKCGQEYGTIDPNNHDFGEWINDRMIHYRICQRAGCGVRDDEEHTFDANGQCVCGAARCFVTFVGNGGEGTMADQAVLQGVGTRLNANQFTRGGYDFDGWNTKADGSGIPCNDGDSVTLSGDFTFYAQWSGKPYTIEYWSDAAGSQKHVQTAYYDRSGTLDTYSDRAVGWDSGGKTLGGWTVRGTGALPADGGSFLNLCGAPDADGNVADPIIIADWEQPVYPVTVEGGSTTQTAAHAGDTVTIIANEPEAGWCWVQWTSNDDGVTFAQTDAATTTFTMPDHAVTVSAVFKEISLKQLDDQIYTGQEIKPKFGLFGVSLIGKDGIFQNGVDYDITYADNVNIGTATVTVTFKGHWVGSKSTTFQIIPASISTATIEVADQTYAGTALTPEATVTWRGKTLEKDKDYTVEYSDNVNAGQATVTVTGKGNFEGSASGTFTINKAPLKITANDQEYVYNGQIQGEGDTAYEDPAEIAEKVTVEGLQGSDALTSVILDGQAKDARTYDGKIVPSNATVGEATGNYTITYVPGKLTIDPAHAIVQADDKTKTEGQVDPPLTATVSGFLGSDGDTLSYSLYRNEGEAPGEYRIGVLMDRVPDNYDVMAVPGTLTIRDKCADGHNWDTEWSYDENGHYHKCLRGCGAKKDETVHSGGTATCVSGPICEICGQEYGVTDPDAHYGGTATCVLPAICEGCGQEYGVTDPDAHDWGPWTIHDFDSWTTDPDDFTHHYRVCRRDGCGAKEEAAHSYDANGLCVCGAVRFEITANTTEAAYGEQVTITHTLPDGAAGTIQYYLHDGTFFGVLDVSESLELPVLDAGNWTVIALYYDFGDNTRAAATVSFDVLPADISAAKVEAADQTYSGTAQTPAPAVTLGGVTLREGRDYTVTDYADNVIAGSATVTVTGKGNYSGTATGSFTISKASLTVTADSETKVYDGTALTKNGYESTALAAGDTLQSVTVTGSQTDAGSSDNVPSAARIVNAAGEDVTASYDVTYANGTLTVTKASITIKAEDKTKVYDGDAATDPALTATVTGKPTSGVDPVYSLSREAGQDAKDYAITVTADAADNPNYTVMAAGGMFTITPADVTLTANSGTETYDGTEKTVTGFTPSVAGLTFAGVSASGKGTNAGSYDVTFSGVTVNTTRDDTGNYVVTGTTKGTLTIDPAAVTITVDNKTKVRGEDDPVFASTVEGLIAAGDLGEITYTRTNADVEDAGTYAGVIDAAYTANPNYAVTVVKGSFTILEKYTVIWKGADGSELSRATYAEGESVPTYTGQTPTKPATAQYSYTFARWNDGTVEGTTTTYEPIFTETVNKYTVKFVDYDGTTVLKEATIYDFGTPAENIARPDDPVREADAEYSYTSTGWTPEIVDVTADAIYTAVYSSGKQSYTVTWLQDDGTQIDQTTVEYGETPVHADPTKPADAQYTYTFAGWMPEIVPVTDAATYTATYTETVNEYTVRFDTNGGSAIDAQRIKYGGTAEKPADPTKNGNAFDGWYGDAELSRDFDFAAPITGDTTVYAKWTPNDYRLNSITGATDDDAHEWTKDSGTDVVSTVKLTVEPDVSFAHFVGVEIDGVAQTRDVDYTAREGSTIVTLKAAALQKLSVGEHTVSILFDNGRVDYKLTVKAAPEPTTTPAPTSTPKPTATPAPKSSSPKTGDDSSVELWAAMAIGSLLSLAALLIVQKRRYIRRK